jgi:hypothetical protein
MLSVIILFTAIVLIYTAIVLAVWWLPKEANSPPSEKDEPLSPKQRMIQLLLKIVTGLYILLLIPACFLAVISPFAMTGSAGSQQDRFAAFLVMATFPFTIIASILVAWILFRRRNVGIALSVTLIPIVQLVVTFFVPGIWSAY